MVHQVHEDLRLVRKWSNLSVQHSAERAVLNGIAPPQLDAVFPQTDEHTDRTRVVLPLASDSNMTVAELHALCERTIDNNKHRCVTLALGDDDSTTAYYRAFTQFNEIVHPQWKTKKERAGAPGDIEDEESSEDDDDEASESDDGVTLRR